MGSASAIETKKALVAAGLEVYLTRGDEVQVADRVRDNLIMDSGVSIHSGDDLRVRIVVRAQRCDFPADSVQSLFDKARALGAGAVARGYRETETRSSPVRDPIDETRTLDTWYEVFFEKNVATLSDAIDEVRFAVSIEKAAGSELPGDDTEPQEGGP